MPYCVRVALDCLITIPAVFIAAFGFGFAAAMAVIVVIVHLLNDSTIGVVCGVILGMQFVFVALSLSCHIPMFSGRCVPTTLSAEESERLQSKCRRARYGLGGILLAIAVQSTTLSMEFSPLRLGLAVAISLLWFPIASWLLRGDRLAVRWQANRQE